MLAATTCTLSYAKPSASSVPADAPPAKPSNEEAQEKSYLEVLTAPVRAVGNVIGSLFSESQEEAEKARRRQEEAARRAAEARRRQEEAREEARRREEARLREDAQRQYEETRTRVNGVIQQNVNEGLQAVRGGNFEVAGSVTFFIGLINKHLRKHLTPKTEEDMGRFESELGNRFKTTQDGLMRSLSASGNAREALEELGDLTALAEDVGALV